MSLEDVVKRYKVELVEDEEGKKLLVPSTPFYIIVKEGRPAVVRLGVDRERLEELIEEMFEEGESADSVEDALNEMIDDVIRIAYSVINELEKEGKEVKSELLSSVMDIKDILSEELEYVEEVL
ncbi:MAG: hypothetical protein GXO07_05525 [Crenarchaeota archaeon]|nr:hypothetical protein [Thermoproteota archaeon]